MSVQTKKRIAWALMSGGIGAALLFGMVLGLEGKWLLPHERAAYAWPVIGMVAGVYGWRWLRALYRAEPPVPPAAWTVSLADLLCATIFAGLCSALMGASERLAGLMPVAGIAGFALYLNCALAASLRGVTRWRVVFVVGHACVTLGLIGVGSLAIILCLLPIITSSFAPIEFVYGLFSNPRKPWMRIHLTFLCALPVGVVLLALWRRLAEDVRARIFP